ncbi:hypothetical protein [Frondihabitans sucicola]|uniref:hypothetical protein n=1 Tax=Frondihabitans sucicola TaxID=1268041 RepID=UPI0025738524|nr:hypothetical protein [Frondihabitans sucicola]
MIWATRGRTWGTRFLLDGGVARPLAIYESAFAGTDDSSDVFRHIDDMVALRLRDPEGRRDEAGRIILHEFVILAPDSTAITTADEAVARVWPQVDAEFARIWDASSATLPEGATSSDESETTA